MNWSILVYQCRSVLTRLKLCISMPNFSLSVVTTQGLLITFTSIVLCAQTVSEMWVPSGKAGSRNPNAELGPSFGGTQPLEGNNWFKGSNFNVLFCVLCSLCTLYHQPCSFLIFGQNFSSPLNQLQNRIWLMHWALFIFFNHIRWYTCMFRTTLFSTSRFHIILFFGEIWAWSKLVLLQLCNPVWVATIFCL